jgi:superfamily II DNA or RNA helicase
MQMIKKRTWQDKALEKFRTHMDKHFLLDATPGSGKTIFAALAALYLFERSQIDFVLIVVPTTAIKGDRDAGFLGDWHKALIEITTVLKDGQDAPPKQFRGAVITFQQLPNIIGTIETWVRNGLRLFSVFDELHHASDDNTWGDATERLGKISMRTLGMTGTCFRGDQRRITFVKYDANDKAIADYTYSYRQSVTDHVCRKVVFLIDDSITQFMLDEENHNIRISEAKTQDEISGATRTVFRTDHEFLPMVILKADDCLDQYRTWDLDAGGLIVCRSGKDDENDERHLHRISGLMHKTLNEAPEVISYEDRDANPKIERFRKSGQRWISAVRKISEGVDIKRLRVLIMATRPTTELLFRQIIGRVLRVDDDKRPGDATVLIAKFPQLVEWAERIAEEAEAGLKDRKPNGNGGTGEARSFMSFGATHENSGAISDFGDHYSTDEVNAAEKLRSGDPQLIDVSITTLAHLQRKLGIIPEPFETAEPPLQIKKKELRADIVTKARHLAIKRNADAPDFKLIWREIGAHFGPYSADDLTDNYSIEIMRQIKAWLIARSVRENHDP